MSEVIAVSGEPGTVIELDGDVIPVPSSGSVIEVGYTQPGGSVGDKFFRQDFNMATSVTVTHNLGKSPAVSVANTFGEECEADVFYVDSNTVTVGFQYLTSGTIYCN